MRNTRFLIVAVFIGLVGACTATETKINEDFGFDGTCTNCHNGLTAGHVHKNYKLRCIDCHGGNDAQGNVPKDAFAREADFRNPVFIKDAHVRPRQELARFFYANGIDDDGDGNIDEGPVFEKARAINATAIDRTGNAADLGEVIEPGLHGEGPGEFFDTELNRDLNYTRWLNPGDLRIATISCGAGSRAAIDGGGGGVCHQQTIDIVRRSIMVNQAAVTNGAYYGNENWRQQFIDARDAVVKAPDPRFGGLGYALDYDGPDGCIDFAAAKAEFDSKGPGGRIQPVFDTKCLQDRVTMVDRNNAGPNAPGNSLLQAFEIAEGTIKPTTGSDRDLGPPNIPGTNESLELTGAGDLRLPWGGNEITGDAHAQLAPLKGAGTDTSGDVVPAGGLAGAGIPSAVDVILRTFRAYYPLNYPGSTTNFNFTFGTSIFPEQQRFRTANPYGRGHSSGCAACHAPYNYEGNRRPQRIRQDDGTFVEVVDPTTKHREFDPKTQDRGVIDGKDRLIGRIVTEAEQQAGRGGVRQPQQRTFSSNHELTTKIDTDTCGLCHGFVTRINYAYQGMAEEEQRDQLSRRAASTFMTPGNKTTVQIHDSWVREDFDPNETRIPNQNNAVVIAPTEGLKIIELAKKRNADLAKQGFIPGAGGCAAAVFTEDCNNNGELDKNLVLERRDENGNVVATITINEDLDGDNVLDLIDRLPREKAIDGRQVRYVYGGRNGSTRQMDVHFERGMHCIDCHFIQDVHGDGNVYSTNWDAIEIECEDCHGTQTTRATLVTSGPNGGNDLTRARNEDLLPFFERKGGQIIQRSRVNNGVFWIVPQTQDVTKPSAVEGHAEQHVGEQKQGSEYEGVQGESKMLSAKVECAACHNGWIHNCVGCHVEVNIGDLQRDRLLPGAGNTIVKDAGENEVWLNNTTNRGHINFQLLGQLRSPVVLGASSRSEQGRLATFRSSMQVQASVSDINGDLLRDNLSFTTFQVKDGNTGRPKAPTSGVAMNQTMPHTVRPAESRGCETCHSLMNDQGQVRNEAIMNQTMGIGTGALPYLGDWVFAAGTNGLELFEHKEEKELAAVKANPLSTSHRFPGLIMDPGNNVSRVDGKVEPIQVGAVGTDVVLIRNFNAEPVRVPSTLQAELAPTLRDLAVLGLANGTVQIIDVSERGHPTAVTRPAVGNQSRVTNINIPGANAVTGLAHMGSDVSDPFVYVATDTGVVTLKIGAPPNIGVNGQNFVVDQLTLTGKSPTAIAIGGDRLYVGTANGTIEVISVDTPNDPVLLRSIALPGAPVVNGMNLSGFTLYLATTAGTAAVNLENPDEPGPLLGLSQIQYVGGPSQGVYAFQGIVFAAAGPQGVLQIDYKTPAAPINLGTIGGGNAVDVVVSRMPGQVWVISLNSVGNVHYTKLNNQDSPKEVCFPNPAAAGCTLDMEFRDMTAQSTRDPSFNPANGQFDVLDPSHQSFVQVRRILGGGQRMARPTLIEQLNTLTGRRYRDSFMPGSGTISLEVMQRMRQVQVCETETPGNDPAGLNELGYFLGPGQCVPFGASAKPRKVCRIEHVGGPEVCKLEPIHVDPATLPGVFAAKTRRHVAPGRLVPAAAPNAPLVPVTQPNPVSSKPPPAAIPVTAAPAAAASVGASAR